jgi:4-carboxymuconolactone decarboxylase
MPDSTIFSKPLPECCAYAAKTFEKVFAAPAADFESDINALADGFGTLILNTEFGNIYSRPGLDLKTRELCIIASCATLGSTGESALRMHIPAAIRAGATWTEITEVIVQVSMAAGLPAAMAALQIARTLRPDSRPQNEVTK